MSQTKVKSGLLNFPDQTDFVKLPSGTTAQRPVSPEKGYSRYNTTDNKLEFWNGTLWQQLPGVVAPIITSVSYPGDDLAADPAGGQTITINGSDFQSGATVTVGGTTPSVITFVSATQITFEAPAKAAGDYDIVVTNPDGGNATSVNGMAYNGVPSWTTPAGNLGSFEENTTIPTITLVAAEPDSGTISYSVTTGALPNGLTLSGANITGTSPSVSGETTYNFSVTATDNENQSTERAFNIVVYQFIPSFNTVTYTGNNSSNGPILNVGFSPDFAWIKARQTTSTGDKTHRVHDVVRGSTKTLSTDTTDIENDGSSRIDFNYSSTQVQITSASFGWNAPNIDYVGWFLRAGGSNTNGNGTGGVSNVVYNSSDKSGFSIVTYTGNGSSGTFEHGLNSEPELIIAKNRTLAGGWNVCGSVAGLQYGVNRMRLEDGAAITPDTNEISGVTSSLVSVSTSSVINQGNIVAYCFYSVPNFSKIGSYVGNGSSSGPTVDLGFEPAFIMTKCTTDSTYAWLMTDNKRGGILYANLDNQEYSPTGNDFDDRFIANSTGFQVTTTNGNWNENGETYLYIAFANQF